MRCEEGEGGMMKPGGGGGENPSSNILFTLREFEMERVSLESKPHPTVETTMCGTVCCWLGLGSSLLPREVKMRTARGL